MLIDNGFSIPHQRSIHFIDPCEYATFEGVEVVEMKFQFEGMCNGRRTLSGFAMENYGYVFPDLIHMVCYLVHWDVDRARDATGFYFV